MAEVCKNIFSVEAEEIFSQTDTAIENLHPWRSDIPLKVFSSRIREVS